MGAMGKIFASPSWKSQFTALSAAITTGFISERRGTFASSVCNNAQKQRYSPCSAQADLAPWDEIAR